MADTNTNEGSARANEKLQSIYTATKKKSILTIRTGRVGGKTRVCRVCFPACALISSSADVQVEVKQVEVEDGKAKASIRVCQPSGSRLIDLIFKTRKWLTSSYMCFQLYFGFFHCRNIEKNKIFEKMLICLAEVEKLACMIDFLE